MEWIATCPHETVDTLVLELHALGIQQMEKLHRGIRFNCDLETAYIAHLQLRTASRIQRIVAQFPVSDLKSIETGLKSIQWTEWLRSHRPFTVRPSLSDQEAIKLNEQNVINCVVESIHKSPFEKSPPKFDPEHENPITIVLFIRGGSCVLGLDTAGRALHKRGWRTNGHPAVLKETLAASILMLAGYTGEDPLLDPMCGSGTVVIEAAYMALNKAPLIHRGKDDFALEHLAGFDRPLWRKVSDRLRAQKRAELPAPIFACDINPNYLEVARASALRARVEKYLTFSVCSIQQQQPPAEKGLLIANLPYGERIGGGIIDKLYREIGIVIKERFSHWKIALMVPTEAPIHLLGLKPNQEYSLLNGALPVKLLIRNPVS
jgi:putative N6-adenine-specific DNA methylase